MTEFKNVSIVIDDNKLCAKAAELFSADLADRMSTLINIRVADCDNEQTEENTLVVEFKIDNALTDYDSYSIAKSDDCRLRVGACSLRGFIYGYGNILRKSEFTKSSMLLIEDISGVYIPEKQIRGHQLGYRPLTNTYDKWSPKDYRRYLLDTMAYGSNFCEFIPGIATAKRNDMMLYEPDDMIVITSQLADELDLGVSVWYPNDEDDTSIEDGTDHRAELAARMKRFDVYFPPGGDPGKYPGDEYVRRTRAYGKALKDIHPNLQVWPSAQKPKRMPSWGDDFLKALTDSDDGIIDGVIHGPNAAFELDDLRRRLPQKYPIRLYPDISHNVRCDYPVNHDQNDWHFAIASTMGRETINPRPHEYRTIHKRISRYAIGAVTYSEGVSDDINKFLYASLDWNGELDVIEILKDYSRLFFVGCDPQLASQAIISMERNWQGDPAENIQIDFTLMLWKQLLKENKAQKKNWRFMSMMFRAYADKYVRDKRIFELDLCKEIKQAAKNNDFAKCRTLLNFEYPQKLSAIYDKLCEIADFLFSTIGIQLDVEKYGAMNYERGATLTTINNPITDIDYYKYCMENITRNDDPIELFKMITQREQIDSDELFFSVTKRDFNHFGVKPKLHYSNYSGDKPFENDGSLPISLLTPIEAEKFEFPLSGFLPDTDYKLRIIIKNRQLLEEGITLLIKADGAELYNGDARDVEAQPDFKYEWPTDNYFAVSIPIPKDRFVNGCIKLSFETVQGGFEFVEYKITKQ